MKQDCQVQWTKVHFHVSHYYTRICSIRFTARMDSVYFRTSTLSTHTKHVCAYITPNYTTVNHRVGIYYRRVAFYRDLTGITVSDMISQWISHHVSRNNIWKNDAGTMHYDIFLRINRLQTVLLHSKNCKDEFRILKYITFVDTY